MFAYCRNCPASRIDTAGLADADCFDTDGAPLSSDELEDRKGGGGSGFWSTFWQSMEDATSGLSMAMGGRNNLSSERHHVLSNKNKTYTPQYKEITDRYDMKLSASENIVELQGHRGRHTNAYHDFMLGSLKELDAIAKGNKAVFYDGFKVMVAFLLEHESLPYAR